MVIRGFGSCATCDHDYMLRAGVGIESYQVHYIDCSACGTPIVLAVRANPPEAYFEVEENFQLWTHENDESTVINLHPSFAFDPEEFHKPRVFVSLDYTERLFNAVKHLVPPEQRHIDTAWLFDVPNISQVWGHVRRGLSLESGQHDDKLLKRSIDGYLACRKRFRPDITAVDVPSMHIGFLRSAFFPRIEQLADPAIALLEKVAAEHPDEFTSFQNFYKTELAAEQRHRFISAFSDYFKYHTQYSQILVHARLGDFNIGTKIVGSKAFEETKLYYGQAYEALTASFVIYACLNNILQGRKYDQFESMTLNKYLKDVEKAKRANPFSNEPVFFAFTQGLDSALRNGSHHASIWRDGDVVYYRSGGSGAERNIPFSSYLHMCNMLTISLAATWLVDRKLTDN